MKTPEEIKKGLECYSDQDGCEAACDTRRCPYADLPSCITCGECMTKDALAYIQQLEEALDMAFATLRIVNKDADEMEKQLDAQRSRWISVEERLPEDDSPYLTYTTDCTCAVYNYDGDGEWVTEWGEDASHNITHWMPLPEPPKEE